MNSFKPQDSKREEFRKYLERSGVLDVLTKTMANLYEELEKPTDALGFFYKALGDDRPEKSPQSLSDEQAKIQSLENELADAKSRIQELEKLLEKNEQKDEDVTEPATDEPPAEGEEDSTVPTSV